VRLELMTFRFTLSLVYHVLIYSNTSLLRMSTLRCIGKTGRCVGRHSFRDTGTESHETAFPPARDGSVQTKPRAAGGVQPGYADRDGTGEPTYGLYHGGNESLVYIDFLNRKSTLLL